MENKYRIFDTHAHYDDDSFDEDRDAVLSQIKENGVVGILNCASSYESIEKTYKLTIDNDFIYGALGIHPENADEFNDDPIKAWDEHNANISKKTTCFHNRWF